jgi:hypothetical protein
MVIDYENARHAGIGTAFLDQLAVAVTSHEVNIPFCAILSKPQMDLRLWCLGFQ